MDEVSIMLAFSAGLLSFLSPCVLPLIPAYVSYLTGTAIKDINTGRMKRILLIKSFGFVIGFSIVFLMMGASISFLGRFLTANNDIFRILGGMLIIIFGLHTTGLVKIKQLYFEKKILKIGDNNISSVLLGMAFAAGWTPCIGPILSSILIYAGNMETIGEGILLLTVYSLGLAIPFLLTALAVGNITKYIDRITRYLPLIAITSGIIMIVMGLLVIFNKMIMLNQYFNFINI